MRSFISRDFSSLPPVIRFNSTPKTRRFSCALRCVEKLYRRYTRDACRSEKASVHDPGWESGRSKKKKKKKPACIVDPFGKVDFERLQNCTVKVSGGEAASRIKRGRRVLYRGISMMCIVCYYYYCTRPDKSAPRSSANSFNRRLLNRVIRFSHNDSDSSLFIILYRYKKLLIFLFFFFYFLFVIFILSLRRNGCGSIYSFIRWFLFGEFFG